MISSEVDKHNFKIIFRNKDNQYYQHLNNIYPKDSSYDYWRSHLDFAFSMSQCLQHTDTPLMWLEYDTIVDIGYSIRFVYSTF